MATIYEVMKKNYKNRFEVIIREDGIREYRTWTGATLAEDGIVTALGVKYADIVTLVTPDDMEIIDVVDIDNDLYETLIFVNDVAKWEAIHGIKGSDLIGLPSEEFYTKANERCIAKEN